METIDWSQRIRASLRAVARRRCPQCGQGPAFSGWCRMKPSCEVCGRRFQSQPGSTTGVMQVGAMAVVIFALAAWFVIDAVTSWPLDFALIVLMTLSIVFGSLFYPYARLLWEAVDALLDLANRERQ